MHIVVIEPFITFFTKEPARSCVTGEMVLLVLFDFEGFRTIIFLFAHKLFCTILTVAFNAVMRSLVNI